MRRLIRAEWLKLTTTRGALWLLIGAIAINVFAIVAPGENALREFDQPLAEHQSLFVLSMLMRIFLLVLGVRAVTEELRHGTMTPSLLTTPRRPRLVGAKAITLAGAGAIFAVVTTAALVGTMTVVGALSDVELHPLSESWRTLTGMTLVGVVWPLIGMSVGLLVRSQLGAIVGGIIWLMMLESVVSGRLGGLGKYLPGEAGIGAALAPTTEALAVGLATLAVYALIAIAAGSFVLERRDV
jgi:ABC-2 type transport system permease protein